MGIDTVERSQPLCAVVNTYRILILNSLPGELDPCANCRHLRLEVQERSRHPCLIIV